MIHATFWRYRVYRNPLHINFDVTFHCGKCETEKQRLLLTPSLEQRIIVGCKKKKVKHVIGIARDIACNLFESDPEISQNEFTIWKQILYSKDPDEELTNKGFFFWSNYVSRYHTKAGFKQPFYRLYKT